jgi:riboflavin synthase
VFTGIIEELGEVSTLVPGGDSAVLTIKASIVGADVTHGVSICVNGVCLTVVGFLPAPPDSPGAQQPAAVQLDFDVMAETLNRSVIGELRPGDKVNLERSVRVDGRLDGHVA